MRKTYFTLFLLILFAVDSVLIAGTTGKIAGTIKDSKSNESLAGANILIEGTIYGAAADNEGRFIILSVPPGTYSLKATMMGYKTTIMTDVRVKIDQTTTVHFLLDLGVIAGEEVTVIAEKPKIELDLTSSKQTLSTNEINQSWGIDIKEVISDLPGVNVNGGIRGGFGLHDAYQLDGMDMRDVGSNTNFNTINLSSVKEVEVLTGGYNAEYGRANGAIMNIVTKTSSDRVHGTVNYKMRPAGKYHWGSNIYGDDTFQRTVMTTPEFWDPTSKWQTQWMTEPHSGYSGDVSPFIGMTPEERAEWWKKFVNDKNFNSQMGYADRMEWETEATLYGPITSNLGFMLSGRYREGVARYPTALKYNPDMTFQGAINYRLTKSTKIDLTGVFNKFKNSGASKTNFGSSEDTFHDDSALPFVRDPYDKFVYWLWGSYSSSNFNMRAPEYANFFNMQAKVTHTFNPTTFMEVAFQHSQMDYTMNYRDVMKSAYYSDLGFPMVPDEYPVTQLPSSWTSLRWAAPGDIWLNKVDTKNTTLKADLTSQVTDHHQLKLGGLFSYQEFNKILHDHQGDATDIDGHLTDLGPTRSNPYEGAFYIQDKIELEGMVINAGVRVDFFDGNRKVSENAFDPLMLSDSTAGNNGTVGHISYDPDGSGPGYVDMPTRWAISPRFGISHPISQNSVLHFMYGEFYQRPPWQKIVGPVIVETNLPTPEQGGTSEVNLNPDSTLVHYNFYTHGNPNPGLTWEKMTQWEVGIEQNIADLLSMDVTLYYRHARDLTSRGIRQGPNDLNISETGGQLFVEMYGDPNAPSDRVLGKTIGFFETFVNGAWAQVRGIEASLGSKFRHFNFSANYTLSFLTTGEYHLDEVYKYYPERNTYTGANNRDSGINGRDDDSWQPHNSAVLKFSVVTPPQYGPTILNIHPFSNWILSSSTSWSQGFRFTYYPVGTPAGEQVPNNKIWKDKWNTNMNVTKRIGLFNGMNIKFSMQIRNLFNQKDLRLPASGDDRNKYFEEGILPVQELTKEPLMWSWYYNNPREIYFGCSLEF
jgi:hypothetical protein